MKCLIGLSDFIAAGQGRTRGGRMRINAHKCGLSGQALVQESGEGMRQAGRFLKKRIELGRGVHCLPAGGHLPGHERGKRKPVLLPDQGGMRECFGRAFTPEGFERSIAQSSATMR